MFKALLLRCYVLKHFLSIWNSRFFNTVLTFFDKNYLKSHCFRYCISPSSGLNCQKRELQKNFSPPDAESFRLCIRHFLGVRRRFSKVLIFTFFRSEEIFLENPYVDVFLFSFLSFFLHFLEKSTFLVC